MNMNKRLQSLRIKQITPLPADYFLLALEPRDGENFPEQITPGQFVEIQSPDKSVMLRRPISIHFVDRAEKTLLLLIRAVGAGTKAICTLKEGDALSLLWPLGNGFSSSVEQRQRVVLVGGGVGVAPLLYQAALLNELGAEVVMVYGARSAQELVVADAFKPYAELEICTDDGSRGVHGLVTQAPALTSEINKAAMVQCCGPAPMMKAVARICKAADVPCEVSLENMMACGLGACLCCVEKTVRGNVCVCTEGPVFNINELTW